MVPKLRQMMILGAIGLAFSAACSFLAPPPPGGTDTTNGGGDTTDADGASTGTLRLLVTDKPFPFEFIKEALITITRVEVRSAEADDGNTNGGDGDDGNTNGGDGDDGNTNGGDGDDGNTNGGDGDDGNTNGGDGDDGNTNGGDGDDGNTTGDDGDDDDSDDDSAFIVIFEGERSFNLLDLQNGRTDLLAATEIPAGTYTQMRLMVTEGTVVLDDEEMREFNLRVPSGAQSGIKLKFTFEVEADTETTLLLDIDLSRAFSPIPGGRIDDVSTIRNFRFQPSLAMRLINLVDAGSISGTVTDGDTGPIEAASVTAFDGDDELGTTSTEADGTYTLGSLPAGTYRVEFSASGFEDLTIDDVSVTAGETTEGVDAVMSPSEGNGDGDGGGDGG
ncbi:MAG: DUF4382 domain-containing protein [Phycisphaerae bacterium]